MIIIEFDQNIFCKIIIIVYATRVSDQSVSDQSQNFLFRAKPTQVFTFPLQSVYLRLWAPAETLTQIIQT